MSDQLWGQPAVLEVAAAAANQVDTMQVDIRRLCDCMWVSFNARERSIERSSQLKPGLDGTPSLAAS